MFLPLPFRGKSNGILRTPEAFCLSRPCGPQIGNSISIKLPCLTPRSNRSTSSGTCCLFSWLNAYISSVLPHHFLPTISLSSRHVVLELITYGFFFWENRCRTKISNSLLTFVVACLIVDWGREQVSRRVDSSRNQSLYFRRAESSYGQSSMVMR